MEPLNPPQKKEYSDEPYIKRKLDLTKIKTICPFIKSNMYSEIYKKDAKICTCMQCKSTNEQSNETIESKIILNNPESLTESNLNVFGIVAEFTEDISNLNKLKNNKKNISLITETLEAETLDTYDDLPITDILLKLKIINDDK